MKVKLTKKFIDSVDYNAKKDWNRVKPRTKHIEEQYLGMYLKTLLNYVDRSSHMQAPHSNNARDIMLLFMFTGVRLNEAQSLKWLTSTSKLAE